MHLLLLLTIFITSVSCQLTQNERQNLVHNSDVHTRPNKTTTVEVSLSLTAFNKLDSVKQELGTTFLLQLVWTDYRLRFNPINTNNTVFYVNEIWTPPLVINNAIEDSMFLLRNDIFPMRVNPSGKVTWIPRISATTTCNVDTSLFPVDEQVCYINITSWVHSTNELTLVTGDYDIKLDQYTKDKAWNLTSFSVNITETGGYGIEYQYIKYKFCFKRQDRFYWVLLVIPGICLAFLQPFVFVIPLTEPGARLSYITAMLLSFLFYAGVLNSILPPIFDKENKHVLGESFSLVMIFGTLITGLVASGFCITRVLKRQHCYEETQETDQGEQQVSCNACDCENIRNKCCTHFKLCLTYARLCCCCCCYCCCCCCKTCCDYCYKKLLHLIVRCMYNEGRERCCKCYFLKIGNGLCFLALFTCYLVKIIIVTIAL